MVKFVTLLILPLTVCFGWHHLPLVKYQWNHLNFTWLSSKAYDQALRNGSYIPANNILAGIKIWKDRMYLTIPRFKNGVPATLVSTPLNPTNGNISPPLEPFPNWKMQELDNCSAFQFVQSMEIDPLGRMWILENGRTEIFTFSARTKCPAKLVIVDLENNNEMLLDYEFPDDVVFMDSVLLNDVVLDHEDGGYAYITDSDSKFPGIIVFSLKSKTSWKITHKSMKVDKKAVSLVINGISLNVQGPINGIALSPASTEGYRVLYYAPLSSYNLYSVPVSQLKNNDLVAVSTVGVRSSQSNNMFMSSTGNLYYGLLNKDTVAVWNTNLPFEEHTYFCNRDVNQWPNTFAMDSNGYLYWTSNRLHRSLSNQLNLNEPNYRVIVSKTYAKGYQYYQD